MTPHTEPRRPRTADQALQAALVAAAAARHAHAHVIHGCGHATPADADAWAETADLCMADARELLLTEAAALGSVGQLDSNDFEEVR